MNYNDNNVCGRCGALVQGIECPQCGLVMCKDIITNLHLKLKLLNSACNLLMDRNLIPAGVKLNGTYASFYYLLESCGSDHEILGAFKIIAPNYTFYFNYNNTLQYLKPEGKDLYEREFNNVRNIHKIHDSEMNNSNYRVHIEALKNYAEVACNRCQTLINPYDIVCSKCQTYFGNNYPNFFKNLTLMVNFDNNMGYYITLNIPNNLDVVDDGSNSGYLTLVYNLGPAFISFKFYNQSLFAHTKNLIQSQEMVYFGKNIKKGYAQFENGDVIFTSEMQFNDSLYGKMEYQINNAKSINMYNENDFIKYLAILVFSRISNKM